MKAVTCYDVIYRTTELSSKEKQMKTNKKKKKEENQEKIQLSRAHINVEAVFKKILMYVVI